MSFPVAPHDVSRVIDRQFRAFPLLFKAYCQDRAVYAVVNLAAKEKWGKERVLKQLVTTLLERHAQIQALTQ